MTRRQFIPLVGIAATAGYASLKLQKPPKVPDGPPGSSAVAIVRARSYSEDLVSHMLAGIRQCGLDVRGKKVLLKPNLVEFDSATVVNTDASIIAAARRGVPPFGRFRSQDRRRAGASAGHARPGRRRGLSLHHPQVRKHLHRFESRRRQRLSTALPASRISTSRRRFSRRI